MKLDQKYFIPFMVIVALFTMVFIVLTSFNFQQQQQERFTEFTLGYDSLLTKNHPYINKPDSVRLGDLSGSPVLLVFWSTWSEKSRDLFEEIDLLSKDIPNLKVVAALVKDVTDSAEEATLKYDFLYIDGTILFNEIRAPGIPSYVLLDEQGVLLSTNVGYKEGAVKELF
ncbi:MAG: hypothetical protein BalsKO_16790 [Balneolaceae bacterium]